MQLPGRLRDTTLGDVLGALYRERATGLLELREPQDRIHRVHLKQGLVCDVESASLQEEARERREQRVKAVFFSDRPITLAQLSARCRSTRGERLESLFAVRDAALRFHVAVARTAAATVLEPAQFLAGRPRVRDRRVSHRSAVRQRSLLPDEARARALRTLGLSEGSSDAQISQAFRDLARELHPDRHPFVPAEEKTSMLRRFSEVSAAYHSLIA